MHLNKSAQNSKLIYILLILCIFGSFFIYNATSVYSTLNYGTPYRFAILHLAWLIIGFIGFVFFLKLDLNNLKPVAKLLAVGVIIPLIIVGSVGLLRQIGVLSCSTEAPFVPCINGASRWLYINSPPLPAIPFIGVLGFQPSELAKLVVIIINAVILAKYHTKDNKAALNILDRYPAFNYLMFYTGIFAFLILLQPNLSTALIVVMISLAMYFASGASLKPLYLASPILGVLGVVVTLSSGYRRERLFTLLKGGASESLGYHINQIQIALGSGGIWGVGLGQSRQKHQYLPEVSADSIFAVIGEEMGFIGTVLVILLFVLFMYKGYKIALEQSDVFLQTLAVGLTTWVVIHFLVNIGAVVGLIPLTGVPLPFISYGGSSVIFILMGMGLLANISMEDSQKRKFKQRR